MRRILPLVALVGVWVSVACSSAGFLLPWATIDVHAARLGGVAQHLKEQVGRVTMQFTRGSETIAGELLPDLSAIPTQVNGPQIPRLLNRRDAKVAIALAEMLAGQRDLGAKSYAVYLVPGLALVFGVIVTLARRRRLACGLIGAVCLAAAGAGWWKLLTTPTEHLLAAIVIGPGVWLSLWAYVGLGLVAAGLATVPRAH